MTKKSQEYVGECAIVIGGLILMNLIFIPRAFRETDTVTTAAAGQLGDFVGGYVGTIITLISVVLLFWTLRHQRESSTSQSFENRYFELIQMHRQNVVELQVGESSGRKVFVDLVREFRCIHDFVGKIAESTSVTLDNIERFHVSYYVLMFGVGPNSSRMLESSLSSLRQNEFVQALNRELTQQALGWREFFQELESDRTSRKKMPDSWSLSWTFSYVPFEGHLSRLGHYYRHLFQCVSFVHGKPFVNDKGNYVKMIRAQLSTHEQALLLINSLSPLGGKWISNGFIKDYGMVHNIPQNFFNKVNEIDIDEMFGPNYYEWQETAESA